MSDFLTQFKKLQPITIAKSGKTMTGKEIFFMIRTRENDTFIIPVDKKLKQRYSATRSSPSKPSRRRYSSCNSRRQSSSRA